MAFMKTLIFRVGCFFLIHEIAALDVFPFCKQHGQETSETQTCQKILSSEIQYIWELCGSLTPLSDVPSHSLSNDCF